MKSLLFVVLVLLSQSVYSQSTDDSNPQFDSGIYPELALKWLNAFDNEAPLAAANIERTLVNMSETDMANAIVRYLGVDNGGDSVRFVKESFGEEPEEVLKRVRNVLDTRERVFGLFVRLAHAWGEDTEEDRELGVTLEEVDPVSIVEQANEAENLVVGPNVQAELERVFGVPAETALRGLMTRAREQAARDRLAAAGQRLEAQLGTPVDEALVKILKALQAQSDDEESTGSAAVASENVGSSEGSSGSRHASRDIVRRGLHMMAAEVNDREGKAGLRVFGVHPEELERARSMQTTGEASPQSGADALADHEVREAFGEVPDLTDETVERVLADVLSDESGEAHGGQVVSQATLRPDAYDRAVALDPLTQIPHTETSEALSSLLKADVKVQPAITGRQQKQLTRKWTLAATAKIKELLDQIRPTRVLFLSVRPNTGYRTEAGLDSMGRLSFWGSFRPGDVLFAIQRHVRNRAKGESVWYSPGRIRGIEKRMTAAAEKVTTVLPQVPYYLLLNHWIDEEPGFFGRAGRRAMLVQLPMILELANIQKVLIGVTPEVTLQGELVLPYDWSLKEVVEYVSELPRFELELASDPHDIGPPLSRAEIVRYNKIPGISVQDTFLDKSILDGLTYTELYEIRAMYRRVHARVLYDLEEGESPSAFPVVLSRSRPTNFSMGELVLNLADLQELDRKPRKTWVLEPPTRCESRLISNARGQRIIDRAINEQ